MKRIQYLSLVIYAITISSFSGMALSQTVKEEIFLIDKPDGKPTANKLSAGTVVKTTKRQGFWIEVEASGKVGWLKVSNLNFAGNAGGSTAIDTGRLGSGNIVSTSAARGLSAKDLVSGQPNINEVNKLEALSAEPQAVQIFLATGGVTAIKEKIQLNSQTNSGQSVTSGNSTRSSSNQEKKKGNDDW